MHVPRSLVPMLCLAAAACGGAGAAPPSPPPADEVPRPAWQVLVERVAPSGARTFVAMAADRSFVGVLPGVPPEALRVEPSPDGGTLAVLRDVDGLSHLWLVDRDGGHRRELVGGLRSVDAVAWSPDGRRLALEVSSLDATADVWVMNADGTGAVNLTPDPLPAVWYDRAPSWSPDGRRIVFSSNRSGTTRLWIANADGTAPRQVLPSTIAWIERSPAWSPDGGGIAFVAEGPDGTGIALVADDGTDLRLFPAPMDPAAPAWLPDGRVAFSDRRTGDFEVHALDVGTGATTNLTRHRDHDLRGVTLRWSGPRPWRGLAAPETWPAGPPPVLGPAAGDLDGDGWSDVAVLAPQAGEIQVFRGLGTGALSPAWTVPSTDALALAVAEVHRDTLADLVVLERGALAVHRGGPEGPGAPQRVGLPAEGRSMALADVDRNGASDVVVAYERPGSGFHLGVFAADGLGQVVHVLDLATTFAAAGRLAACDATGDGAPDLVALTASPDAPVLLLAGRGDVTFDAPAVAAAGVSVDAGTVPLCADLDGDGRDDLVLLRPGVPAGVAVLPSRGTTFGAARTVDLSASAVAAADLDHDGDVDLLVAPSGRRGLLFLRNRGDGTFAPPVEFPVDGAPVGLAVADLDGDGWEDVVVATAEGAVAVLRNRGSG